MDDHYYVPLYYSLCGVFIFVFHLYFQYHNYPSHVKQAEIKKKKKKFLFYRLEKATHKDYHGYQVKVPK